MSRLSLKPLLAAAVLCVMSAGAASAAPALSPSGFNARPADGHTLVQPARWEYRHHHRVWVSDHHHR